MYTEEQKAMERCLNLLQMFEAVDANFPVGSIRAFLRIAMHPEGVTIGSLKESTDMNFSTLSRWCLFLRKGVTGKRPGVELVSAEKIGCSKVLRLSPRGDLLSKQINALLLRR